MKKSNRKKYLTICISIAIGFSYSAYANQNVQVEEEQENVNSNIEQEEIFINEAETAQKVSTEEAIIEAEETLHDLDYETQKERCFYCDFHGSFNVGYSSNLYDSDSYKSERNVIWGGSLSYSITDDWRVYGSSGGYKSFQDEEGVFATDSVVGSRYSNLLNFGDITRIDIDGQFTMPTSETSRDTKLITAFRLALPVKFDIYDVNLSVTPRVRKNFYEYETYNGRVLTEWVYSLLVDMNYSFSDLTIGASMLGGNGLSFKGSRAREFTYAGSAYASYQFADNWALGLIVSSSGFYADAEKGTLGDFDLFDTEKVTYVTQLTFSF